VAAASEIIAAMCEAAPAGQDCLDDRTLGELRNLTQALVTASPGAEEERVRFNRVRQRSMGLPEADLEAWLRGATVLVTGGTGCIGSTLMRQLARLRPARLVSISRGVTSGWPRLPGAEYLQADIRDPRGLPRVFDTVRPDVVFHLAAQRDPGLAEQEVHRTVTTNVLGTDRVIRAAEEFGTGQVVAASTGKALRPYSREVYTASKRAAEWLLSRAAGRGSVSYSAARFTHVVDNSIIYSRLLAWCQSGVIRLHAADIAFYAQSALESAELLLRAGLGAAPGGPGGPVRAGRRGTVRDSLLAYAITDLGWPFSLLDLALGVLAEAGSDAPIYFSGYTPGYESAPFPGLYDPRTAAEVSPLLNAFEAASVEQVPGRVTDAVPLRFEPGPRSDAQLAALRAACDAAEPGAVRAALDTLSWQVLDESLATVPRQALARVAGLTGPFEEQMGDAYRQILSAIRQHAQAA
jgi:nucleoside-diphosphate-sugar epimerase